MAKNNYTPGFYLEEKEVDDWIDELIRGAVYVSPVDKILQNGGPRSPLLSEGDKMKSHVQVKVSKVGHFFM